MATSGVGLLDSGESTIGTANSGEDKPKYEMIKDGTLCALYNQYGLPNGTKCKTECYLPSTKEYIVIISATGGRMIVNQKDVSKYDEANIGLNENSADSESSPTNEQLIKKTSPLSAQSSSNKGKGNNGNENYAKMNQGMNGDNMENKERELYVQSQLE
eukprot:CAMPEP_0201581036 /NCGR_PEP_ID=MMETSP0190_2-20130828/61240_1 /ASSEMBLY_ACC=CAM_ASM_000263 /TAXON_ID=37353 /ORGANISM="Rosalina sp." /LENGTH=158 /DNA_ID=CAMNT_0048018205 /DNA_START=15 /DNA_END=492 /DNA_ORIENTATION=-